MDIEARLAHVDHLIDLTTNMEGAAGMLAEHLRTFPPMWEHETLVNLHATIDYLNTIRALYAAYTGALVHIKKGLEGEDYTENERKRAGG